MVSKLGCPQVGQLDFEPSLATGRFVAYVFIPYYPLVRETDWSTASFCFIFNVPKTKTGKTF